MADNSNDHESLESANEQPFSQASRFKIWLQAVSVLIFTNWPWKTVKNINLMRVDNVNCGNRWTGLCVSFFIVLFVIAGAFFQLLTCFSRINPYANWKQDLDSNESDAATSSSIRHCQLKCEFSREYFVSHFVPDIIVVLLSFWMVKLKCINAIKQQKETVALNRLVVASYPADQITCNSSAHKFVGRYAKYSAAYIVLSLAVGILYLIAFGITRSDAHMQSLLDINMPKGIIITFSLLGYIAFDLLYIQVIMRYAYQCQLIKITIENMHFHTASDSASVQIKETTPLLKSGNTSTADVEMVSKHIKQLDDKSSVTTGIVILIAGFSTISCIINLVISTKCPFYLVNEEHSNAEFRFMQFLEVMAVILRLFLWTFIALFPVHQVGKVNTALDELGLKSALNKPGFSKGVKYISSRSKAKLIGLPVNPWFSYMACIFILFSIMLGINIKLYERML